jgi:hypothetical protein
MSRRTQHHHRRVDRTQTRDAGVSFVEILVAIVLLGTVAVGVLTAVRTTVIASSIDRDHANAHAWLQSASDLLYGHPRADCGHPDGDIDGNGVDEPDAAERAVMNARVVSDYQLVVSGVTNVEGWPSSGIRVTDVLYWDGDQYQDVCFDDFGINLQLVRISASSPDGSIVEEVEVIKGG